MFSDQVTVTAVVEFAVATTLTGAAGIAAVAACAVADMGETSWPVSTASIA